LVLRSASERHAFGGVSPITGELGAGEKKKENKYRPHCLDEAQICILQSIWTPDLWMCIASIPAIELHVRHMVQCRRYVCKYKNFFSFSSIPFHHDEPAFSLQNRCD
jgi:hypothetical protein